MATLLLVEDDRNQRLLFQEELEEDGHVVVAVPDAVSALAAVRRHMPDLVILDLAMPVTDGVELLGRLLCLNAHLPVIIHSAYASYQDNFMTWTAAAYVLKQSNLSVLKATIRGTLERANGSA